MRHQVVIIAGLLLLLSATLIAAGNDLIEIRGKQVIVEETKPTPNFGVSERNLLGLDYNGKYGLPAQALSADDPVVLKILAIKVQFKQEVPDDPRTTGNGIFDLRSKEQFIADEGHSIDPTPHNSNYFDKHLEALDNYWRTISGGSLELEWEIYPKQVDSAYQLDSQMVYYAALDENNVQHPQFGLGWFFTEAWQKADQDTAIVFWDEQAGREVYDAYMVIRAGYDQQNNLGPPFGPDTYADLFTGYIKLGLPTTVDNGRVTIFDGVMMPEAVSQDNRVVAMNAVMSHEFCHQLGGVDLYDTRTFLTAVGDFALMDNNGFGVNIDLGDAQPVLVQGVMGVFPCAWTRAYLGFEEVVEVTNINNVKIAAAELDTTENQILMVPINADEYYLIENRRTDLDGDNATALKADIGGTEVILGPRSPNPDKPELNREYDFLLPGSGMLIWHVDESVARMDFDRDGISNFDENQLQWFNFHCDDFDFAGCDQVRWDNHRQFMRLIEADGVIDFGREYLSGYGRPEDMFDINNNDEFSPYSNPPTLANNNAFSGITIDDISAALLIMTCDVRIEDKLAGWPRYIGPGPQPLNVFDLDGDGSEEIITAVDNYILAYRFDGSLFFTPPEGSEVIVERDVFTGAGTVSDTLAVFAAIDGNAAFVAPLAVADLDGDGYAEVVGVTSANKVVCYSAFADIELHQATKVFEAQLDTSPVNAPVIFDYDSEIAGKEIICITEQSVTVFDMSGNILSDIAQVAQPFKAIADSASGGVYHSYHQAGIIGAAAGDFDRDGKIELAEVFLDGRLKIDDGEEPTVIDVGGAIFSDISLADIDDDGYIEIIFCGDNCIYAYNYNGTPVSNFPFVVNHYIPSGPIRSNPAIVDLDGDGKREIFVGTANGELAAFDLNGRSLDNYPKPPGGRVESAPVFVSNGVAGAVFVVTLEGEISGYQSIIPEQVDWNTVFGSAYNGSSFATDREIAATMTEAIGYVYNYPNPASDQTTVRFAVREAGNIELKLINLAGDIVYETRLEAEAFIDTEHLLDCAGFAPGVYFCQITTESGDHKYCSIAIMK